MKLQITLELPDAMELYRMMCGQKTPFERRVALAVRGGERLRDAEAYKAAFSASLADNAEFLHYLAALDWYFDGEAEDICQLLRQEWWSRRDIPGINRALFSDAFPAEFTVEGISRLLTTASLHAANINKEGER